MDINKELTEELDVAKWQVDAAVNLIDDRQPQRRAAAQTV